MSDYQNLLGISQADAMCNCKIKYYPDGSRSISCFSRDIIRRSGLEERQPRRRRSGTDLAQAASVPERSKRRAKVAVKDIARCNEFGYFVTLTLDAARIDRYDPREVIRRTNYWLDNRVRRNGLKYILIPELHKDGAIHFHGFINDALPLVDSGTLSNGGKPRKPRSKKQREQLLADGAHIVYNIPAWSFGFSTAIQLYGERRAAINYVCKYITKAADKVGGRWYYSGGDLSRPEETYHDIDYAAFCAEHPEAQPYRVEALGCMGITVEV